jgi:hypothetical protein
MRRAWIGAAVLLVLAIAVAVALALPFYTLNPSGTDAVANGKLIVQGDGRAPLNLPAFVSLPPAPNENEFFVVHNATDHLICFRASATNFCAEANQTP